MGTPDYMAPEQVIGREIDARADLYSLGVILYQMVTGSVPFKGDMPMQIAMQHLQMPPPPPRSLRPDLPPAAEQVMLRALAKNPADRYAHAQDFASVFHLALSAAGIPLGEMPGSGPQQSGADNRGYTPHGLFDPVWQGPQAAAGTGLQQGAAGFQQQPQDPWSSLLSTAPAQPHSSTSQTYGRLASAQNQNPQAGEASSVRHDIIAKTSMTLPSFTGILSPSETLAPPSATDATNRSTTSAGPGGPVPTWEEMSSTYVQSPTLNSSGNTPAPPSSGGFRLGRKNMLRSVKETGSMPSVSASEHKAEAAFGSSLSGRDPHPSGALPGAREGAPAGAKSEEDIVQQQSSQSSLDSANEQQGSGKGFTAEQPKITRMLPGLTGTLPQMPGATGALTSLYGEAGQTPTGSLMLPNYPGQGTTGMVLTQSIKVVKVPVAGQPGRFVTGLMPVVRPTQALPQLPETAPQKEEEKKQDHKNQFRILLIALAILVILGAGGGTWLVLNARSAQQSANQPALSPTANGQDPASFQATATADANIILRDPLTSENIHNWPNETSGIHSFSIKSDGYHIFNNDSKVVTALLKDEILKSFTCTLTMAEVKGNDNSLNNQYGIMLRYSVRQNGTETFYFFDIANLKNGEIQFWRYDGGFGPGVNPWTKLWSAPFGKEFHFGQNNKNTLSVTAQDTKFTFSVNGKQIGTTTDTTLKSGQIGMLVNLKGTEVIFTDLQLTSI